MINTKARVGNFTSSEIVALTKLGRDGKSFGEKATTYIAQKNMERKLGRCLNSEKNAKPLTWGKFLEPRVFEHLGMEYIYTSDQTTVHPNFSYWAGSKDGKKDDEGKTIFDIKCPLTLESFCDLVDPIYDGLSGLSAMKVIRDKHTDGEKFYWQLVSNSILDQAKYAELIVYMPYKSELQEIKLMATQSGDAKHYWIAMAMEDELPFLLDEGYYKNINIIRFEVPLEDKLFLAGQVQKAALRLIDPANPVIKQPEAAPINMVDPSTIPLKKIKTA